MNDANEKHFVTKYPKLFRQRNLSHQETAMCWGLECDNGWFSIIDMLCSQLQWDIDKNQYPQIEFTQIKEKFGTLRLYYCQAENAELVDNHLERKSGVQEGMIHIVEQLSAYVCEHCGTNQDIGQTKGWIRTICRKCAEAGDYEWRSYNDPKGGEDEVIHIVQGVQDVEGREENPDLQKGISE
jgi:hypothetical protein